MRRWGDHDALLLVLIVEIGGAQGCVADDGGGDDADDCGDGVLHDGVTLESQAEVQAMAGCTDVEGGVAILGPDVTDLSPLASLARIEGLVIDAPSLTSLEGLGGLEAIGRRLQIEHCAALETLEGLGPARVGWEVDVKWNDRLTSLHGLAPLQVGEGVEDNFLVDVEANPLLRDVEGLGFVGAGGPIVDIRIAESEALDDLGGLRGVEQVRFLEIVHAPGITSLDPLSSLRAAEWITIEGTSIVTLEGLEGLEDVRSLQIHDNSLLTDASALSSAATRSLSVSASPALVTLELPEGGDVTSLSITDAPVLVSLGPNRLGVEAAYGITLGACPALVDLGALAGISTVDRLTITNLDAVDSMSPFDGIVSVPRALKITSNDRLPQDEAEDWARSRGAYEQKVDGNLGAAPHLDECPWECDEECDDSTGTGLCPDGTDETDCNGGCGGE